MTVYELNRDQLDQLKSAYFWDDQPHALYDSLGRPALFPGDIADEIIYFHFSDVCFVPDDFT